MKLCWFATHVSRKSRTRFIPKDPGQDGRDKYFTVAFSWDAGYPILRIRRNGKLAVNAAISHDELAVYDESDMSLQTVILGKLYDYSFKNGLATSFKVKFDTSVSASSFFNYYNELSIQKMKRCSKQKGAKTLTTKERVRPPLVPVKCNVPIESISDLSKLSTSLDEDLPLKACKASIAVGEIKESPATLVLQGGILQGLGSKNVDDRLTHLLLATETLIKGIHELNAAVKELKEESTFYSAQNQGAGANDDICNPQVHSLKVDVDSDGSTADGCYSEPGVNGDKVEDEDVGNEYEDEIFSDIALPSGQFYADSQNSQDFR